MQALLADKRGPVRTAALLGLLDLGAVKDETLNALANDPDKTVAAVAQLGLGRSAVKAVVRGTALDAPPQPASGVMTDAARLSPLVSNLQTGSQRVYRTGSLKTEQRPYTDRGFRFTKVPAALVGAEIIRTANEDDRSTGDAFLTFDLALESTIHIAYDSRISARPEWMKAFADSDLTVGTSDVPFHLWSKNFPAGKVSLGGSLVAHARGPKSNYFVIIQPKPLTPPSTPTTTEPSLAALSKADARRGEALFFNVAACATCHRVGHRGINFGPDLTNLGARMEPKYVVQSILEPNAVITEGFAAHAVEADGKSYLGVLLSTGRTVRLGVAGGQIIELAEKDIAKHETLPISPMPPMGGLLGPQDVADIARWLLTTEQKAAPATTVSEMPADRSPLTIVEKPDRLIIKQSGAMIGEFVFADATTRRPFFANLRAPGGISVTRTWPPVEGVDATDHADMHPGVWLAFGDISGQDFWRNKATMKHESFALPPAWKNDHLAFATLSSLLATDGTKMAAMRCDFSLAPKGHELHLTWAAAITPEMDGFYFGDQEEMGLGVRMATPLTEKNGGLITSSTGKTTAKATWGQPAEWCDYSGTLNGIKAGIKVIPDPANFRPSWWHNRDYGVFVANPFGRKAMKQGETSRLQVRKGETLHLGFTVHFHTKTASPPK